MIFWIENTPLSEMSVSIETPTGISAFWRTIHDNERLALHAALYTWPAGQIQPGWVLDVSSECGFGSLLIAETNPSLRVLGIDLDLAALRYAQSMTAHQRALPVNASAFRLPVPSDSCSGVYVINLLHLLAEPCGALFEVWRALRPGGTAIISVPLEDAGEAGPCTFRLIGQLALRIADFFSEVVCPEEISGQLPAFPSQTFRLDLGASAWVALCRKSEPLENIRD